MAASGRFFTEARANEARKILWRAGLPLRRGPADAAAPPAPARTALREIREETGLSVALREGFRHTVEYYPKPGVRKQVVYFLGEAPADAKIVRQEEEISELHWVEWSQAVEAVTFKNDRNLLNFAWEYLTEGR